MDTIAPLQPFRATITPPPGYEKTPAIAKKLDRHWAAIEQVKQLFDAVNHQVEANRADDQRRAAESTPRNDLTLTGPERAARNKAVRAMERKAAEAEISTRKEMTLTADEMLATYRSDQTKAEDLVSKLVGDRCEFFGFPRDLVWSRGVPDGPPPALKELVDFTPAVRQARSRLASLGTYINAIQGWKRSNQKRIDDLESELKLSRYKS